MSSYDIVRNAIEFTNPERLPYEFKSLGISDTQTVNFNQIGAGDKSKRETYDEWGCLWVRTGQSNMGQVKGHPLHDWSLIDRFKWPDPENEELYKGMERKFEGCEDKYIKTEIFMLLFERLHSLRGFENTLLDLHLEKENIDKLADRIVDFNIALIENISDRFPGQIHALGFTDDWGTELSTFISPWLWDEFFKPKYRKIFKAAKKAGWHVWMHSCGNITEIVDSLIETGVDVLNLQQPQTLGIEEFGRRFSGKVCFSTLCDIQHTLPFKSDTEIAEEAKLLIYCWGTEKGGLILSDYGDGKAIGVPDSRKKVMLEAFKKYDRWIQRT